MPKRTDISSILVIGAGPIIIGQACEFDYSGTQAIKALKEEGYRVILVNSNPATIMTDPGLADATYIEPITPEMVAKVIEKERPDALLPTMGGQTALNCALELDRRGVLDLFGVEMIGARADVIDKAENRERFRVAMDKIGLESPRSRTVHSLIEAETVMEELGLPAVIRPSFTLGGTGGGIAYNVEEFREIVASGLAASPVKEVLIEESVLGWGKAQWCGPCAKKQTGATEHKGRGKMRPASRLHYAGGSKRRKPLAKEPEDEGCLQPQCLMA